MKKFLLAGICFLLGIIARVNAQHCPFDGSHVVVIKVVDKKGRPYKKLPVKFELVEQDNPLADSCTYSKGQLMKSFAQSSTVIMNAYSGGWQSRAKKFSNCTLFGNGCYTVLLNQAENQCMINHDGDFRYEQRKFTIRYRLPKSKKTTEIIVAQENIYSLCTGNGSWCRIEPVTIVFK